jgi:hypothetical protein
MVVYTCNPRTGEAEAGGSRVQGQAGGMPPVVEHLPGKWKALNSNLSNVPQHPPKNKEKKKKVQAAMFTFKKI